MTIDPDHAPIIASGIEALVTDDTRPELLPRYVAAYNSFCQIVRRAGALSEVLLHTGASVDLNDELSEGEIDNLTEAERYERWRALDSVHPGEIQAWGVSSLPIAETIDAEGGMWYLYAIHLSEGTWEDDGFQEIAHSVGIAISAEPTAATVTEENLCTIAEIIKTVYEGSVHYESIDSGDTVIGQEEVITRYEQLIAVIENDMRRGTTPTDTQDQT